MGCSSQLTYWENSHGVATFSLASGAISSPSIPGPLPGTPKLDSNFSQFLAGSCTITLIASYTQLYQKLVLPDTLFPYLPREVLRHAVYNHLFKCKGTIHCKGFDNCCCYLKNISWLHKVALFKKQTKKDGSLFLGLNKLMNQAKIKSLTSTLKSPMWNPV